MPGAAKTSLGGVGRNVAESVRRLGGSVSLLSVLGDDEPGRQVLAASRAIGLDVEKVLTLPGHRTASYTALLDGSGELVGAVADMDIFDAFAPESVLARLGGLTGAKLLVCDANLPSASLDAAKLRAHELGIPAWFEPVSVAKSQRGRTALTLPWHLATPNWEELLAMLGLSPEPIAAAAELPAAVPKMLLHALSSGFAANVLLTLGPKGAVLASRGDMPGIMPPALDLDVRGLLERAGCREAGGEIPRLAFAVQRLEAGTEASGRLLWYRLLRPLTRVQDVTGAGDALLAGSACAFAAGWPLEEAVIAGLLAAHLTLLSDGANSKLLVPSLLQELRASLQPSRL